MVVVVVWLLILLVLFHGIIFLILSDILSSCISLVAPVRLVVEAEASTAGERKTKRHCSASTFLSHNKGIGHESNRSQQQGPHT